MVATTRKHTIVGPDAGAWARRAVLALAAAFLCSLAVSAPARAAECGSTEACFNQAEWQKAVASDYYNKGLWFQGASRTDFGNAADWNNRAGLYFIAGQASNAQWAKAVADEYSRSAVRNAKAADDMFAKARFTHFAVAGSIKRGLAITALTNRGPTPQEELVIAQAAGEGPTATAAANSASGCDNPPNRSWGVGGKAFGIVMRVYPTLQCWKNGEVTNVDLHYENDVTGLANLEARTGDCGEARNFYDWRNHGPKSGRRVLVTCSFYGTYKGWAFERMDCRVALYFHSNGSRAYTEKDKWRCDLHADIEPPSWWPF